MKNNHRVVTLCGSRRFKYEFLQAQKELALDGFRVIPVEPFDNLDDQENWENMSEDSLMNTKLMLNDVHKSKIDIADRIYVINPNGYIDNNTWSEICYARMTKKSIQSLEPIARRKIQNKVRLHLMMAEACAARQYDVWSHLRTDYSSEDYLLSTMAIIQKGKFITMDPWVPEDDAVPTVNYPYIGHADEKYGYNPFKIYGVKKMARFVEEIILRYSIQCQKREAKKITREEMMRQIEWHCNALELALPKGYPKQMSDEEMEEWVEICRICQELRR